jgi:hypothetical protein
MFGCRQEKKDGIRLAQRGKADNRALIHGAVRQLLIDALTVHMETSPSFVRLSDSTGVDRFLCYKEHSDSQAVRKQQASGV